MSVPAAGRPGELDAVLHLLDRQVVDADGRMLAKVDDLELVRREDGSYAVTAVLVGPAALGPRIGGVVGRLVSAVHARLSHKDQPDRIALDEVTDIDGAVVVRGSAASTYDPGFESWARSRFIEKLPGARHDPEE